MRLPKLYSKYIRKKINERYYCSIYDLEDNHLISFENLESCAKQLNKPYCEVYRIVRYNKVFIYRNKKCRLFLFDNFIDDLDFYI